MIPLILVKVTNKNISSDRGLFLAHKLKKLVELKCIDSEKLVF